MSWAFGNSARPTPAISSAIRIAGNDSITSQMRMISASSRPPNSRRPARGHADDEREHRPRRTPTKSEMRAPYISAERMSRPCSSVPSRYLLDARPDPRRRQQRIAQLERREVERVVRRDHVGEDRAEDADQRDGRGADRDRRSAEAVANIAGRPARERLGIMRSGQGAARARRCSADIGTGYLLEADPLEVHVVVGSWVRLDLLARRPTPAPAGAAGCGRCRPGGS